MPLSGSGHPSENPPRHWVDGAVFYHLYPLGTCAAPARNDLVSPPAPRLEALLPWIRQAHVLGATALYLGPVFESFTHGYDTVDLFTVDRRLGTDDTLRRVIAEAHGLGMHVLLDAVFNHTGRGFWAFKELQAGGPEARTRGWYRDVDFTQRSSFGDAFRYAYWANAPDLPRLALDNPEVRSHLLAAVDHWIDAFGIDGLRLDTADCLDGDFLSVLREHCDRRAPGFWLMGEVIHGDYRRWVRPDALHSVTNCELYKGLWSSHADANFFEIAHSLNRQFGKEGMYRGMLLYTFADNHDVNRVASNLKNRAQLFSLYCLLFTVPGIPAVYYGSEWGIPGRRTKTDDSALRPYLTVDSLQRDYPADLPDAIRRLIALRRASPALFSGDYTQLAVAPEQIAFQRTVPGESLVVAVNGGDADAIISIDLQGRSDGTLADRLNPPYRVALHSGRAQIQVPAHWARVLDIGG
jgi:cyclomaltodextrinase / maltogenic alpha-amylase / neopullulanase